jgi:hypothetical protein
MRQVTAKSVVTVVISDPPILPRAIRPFIVTNSPIRCMIVSMLYHCRKFYETQKNLSSTEMTALHITRMEIQHVVINISHKLSSCAHISYQARYDSECYVIWQVILSTNMNASCAIINHLGYHLAQPSSDKTISACA